LAERALEVGTTVAGPLADDVHEQGRYPSESMAAVKDARMLGAVVPVALGGEGASVAEVVDAIQTLSQYCASTGMIFAMHCIQVTLTSEHGGTPELDNFLREVAASQLLVANAASEAGIGGDARRSICAFEPTENGFHVEKQAICVSYGAEADAILVNARRSPDAAPDEQAWCIARPPYTLEPLSDWNAFGLRGTDSRGFRVIADFDAGMVFVDNETRVLDRSGAAINNLFQCSVWLGIAEAAAARAHRKLRERARKDPEGASTAALRLAELAVPLNELRDVMDSGVRRATAVLADEAETGAPLVLAMNTLKVSASSLALDVVHRAMLICGIDGYRSRTDASLGRHLADVYAALVMVNNDRLLTGTGDMLKILKSV
jgi:acyl-CoA dehydrogenase